MNIASKIWKRLTGSYTWQYSEHTEYEVIVGISAVNDLTRKEISVVIHGYAIKIGDYYKLTKYELKDEYLFDPISISCTLKSLVPPTSIKVINTTQVRTKKRVYI